MEIARLHRCAALGGEEKAVLLPLLAPEHTLLRLPLPVLGKQLDQYVGEQERTCPSLRLWQRALELALNALERARYPQRPLVEVDVGPQQAEHLAAPQTEGERDAVEGLQTMPGHGVEQPLRLLLGERGD
jgi:hypothetical protein